MRHVIHVTDEVTEAQSGQVTRPKAHNWEQQWSLNLAGSKAGCCLFTCIDIVLHSLCDKQYESHPKDYSVLEKEEALWIK